MNPYHRSGTDPQVVRVEVYLKAQDVPPPPDDVPVQVFDNKDGTGTNILENTPLASAADLDGLHHAGTDLVPAKNPGEWMIRVQGNAIPPSFAETVIVEGTAHKHLKRDMVADIFLALTFDRA